MAKKDNSMIYLIVGIVAMVIFTIIISYLIYYFSKERQSDPDPPSPNPNPNPNPNPGPGPNPNPNPNPNPKPNPNPNPGPTKEEQDAAVNAEIGRKYLNEVGVQKLCNNSKKPGHSIDFTRYSASTCESLKNVIGSNFTSPNTKSWTDITPACSPNGTINDTLRILYDKNCEPNIGAMFFQHSNYGGAMFAASYKHTERGIIIDTPDWISSIKLHSVTIQVWDKLNGKGKSGIFTLGSIDLRKQKITGSSKTWNDQIRSFKFL